MVVVLFQVRTFCTAEEFTVPVNCISFIVFFSLFFDPYDIF